MSVRHYVYTYKYPIGSQTYIKHQYILKLIFHKIKFRKTAHYTWIQFPWCYGLIIVPVACNSVISKHKSSTNYKYHYFI